MTARLRKHGLSDARDVEARRFGTVNIVGAVRVHAAGSV